MRLTELNPEWHDDDPTVTWLYFDCPHCKSAHALEIAVKQGAPEGGHVWGWNGERDFEKVTLTPSINFGNHWHGWINNGEVT